MTKIVFVGTRVSDLSNTWGVTGNDIYSNYSGNVGIGTSAPTMLLDVSGNAKVSGNVTICGTLFVNDICGVNLGSGGGGGSSQWSDGTGSEIYYQGNVGIGTGMTNPAYALDVSGDIHASTIYADTIDTTSNITIDISNIDGLIQFGSNTMVIDPALNRVGIGKEGPERTLDVAGDVAVSGTLYVDEMAIASQTVFDLSGASDYIQMGSNNTIYADTAYARVGIGKANPTVALDVSGSATVSGNSTVSGNVAIGKSSASVALDVSGSAVVSGNLTVDSTTLVVDASNNRVGIGLNNPSVALDVSGYMISSILRKGGNANAFNTSGTTTYINQCIFEVGSYPLNVTLSATGGNTTIANIPFARTYAYAPIVLVTYGGVVQPPILCVSGINTINFDLGISNALTTSLTFNAPVHYLVIGTPA